MFVICYLLFVICYWLLVIGYLLFVICCAQPFDSAQEWFDTPAEFIRSRSRRASVRRDAAVGACVVEPFLSVVEGHQPPRSRRVTCYLLFVINYIIKSLMTNDPCPMPNARFPMPHSQQNDLPKSYPYS